MGEHPANVDRRLYDARRRLEALPRDYNATDDWNVNDAQMQVQTQA